MALAPGSRLGPYEVFALIGEGGMGQVYRARDTRLNRDVALKILPDLFANDPDRLARFTREAQTLAALNHPHIAHIHGLEESDGIRALVMELVDGDDLSQRIAGGAIPIDEALPIAKQIADALEAAHEQGIIHRDLKPANIKVRDDGTVKVLDFGLAKAMEPAAGSSASASMSPTITTPAMTRAGMILGTAAYMSPEQARGKAVDKRVDIWAFGVVLFEMVTGARPFPGDDVADVLSRVLQREPDLATLPAQTPAHVRTLVARCLVKDPRGRLRDIGEARLALEGAFETAAPETRGTATRAALRERVAWGSAALALIGLATVLFLRGRETPIELPRVHLSMPVPGNAAPSFFALSPDGRSLVMTYGSGLGVRSLESGEIRLLSGTIASRTPFWSPDSRSIAFFAGRERKLKTIAASGGPARTLCDEVGFGAGGTWSRAGVILFATEGGVLTRVPAAGGTCTALGKPEPGEGYRVPMFLPDGEHFLYARSRTDEASRGLYVASLGDPIGRRLLADPSSAVFVPNASASNQGRLLFVREQTLMAQAFDATGMQLSGEPTAVANQVTFTNTPLQIAASADAAGTIVYLANGRPDRQLVWYDRSGTERGRAAMTGSGGANAVSLAPDGKRVVFRRTDAQGLVSLWVQDLERNQETRLTTLPLSPGSAVWSPDGKRIAFGSTGMGADGIYIKDVDGGKEEMVLPGSNSLAPSDWSRDLSLVYTETNPTSGADIWLLAAPSKPSTDRKPILLLRTPAIESHGQLSPDGKWIAYSSDEGGSFQVYLRPFSGSSLAANTKWQVSNAGVANGEPRWRADGRELFYLEYTLASQQQKVMAVPIGAGPNPAGTPKPLFEFRSLPTIPQSNSFLYSPAADGQRFLVNMNATDVQPSLEVILNWGRTTGTK